MSYNIKIKTKTRYKTENWLYIDFCVYRQFHVSTLPKVKSSRYMSDDVHVIQIEVVFSPFLSEPVKFRINFFMVDRFVYGC